jgi:hypothetical protein
MAPITHSHLAELSSLLPDLLIVTPDSPNYDKAIARWMAVDGRKAGAVAFPTASKEVSKLLGFSRTHSLDIAVKSGGHSARSSSSPETGGLCIDLTLMKAVSVDPATKRITVGGGALWLDVYAETDKYDLAVVGGVCPTVGVGGLALHGGYGWLTGAHGLAVDNILEMEVALADGSLLRASDAVNGDLFWAMKGAGGAFGVATQLVLQGYEQKGWVWSGNMVLGRDSMGAVAEVCNKVLAKENGQGKAAVCCMWTILPGGMEPMIIVLPWYNGPEEEAREFFAPLLHRNPTMNTARMMPFSASGTSASPEGAVWRKCPNGHSVMAPLDPVFLDSLFDDLAAFLKRVPDAVGSVAALEVHNPYATMRVGQTGTAFADRGNQANVMVIPTWSQKENDEVCQGWCWEFCAKVAKEFERRKKEDGVDEVSRSSVGIYTNYDGEFIVRLSKVDKHELTKL